MQLRIFDFLTHSRTRVCTALGLYILPLGLDNDLGSLQGHNSSTQVQGWQLRTLSIGHTVWSARNRPKIKTLL